MSFLVEEGDIEAGWDAAVWQEYRTERGKFDPRLVSHGHVSSTTPSTGIPGSGRIVLF